MGWGPLCCWPLPSAWILWVLWVLWGAVGAGWVPVGAVGAIGCSGVLWVPWARFWGCAVGCTGLRWVVGALLQAEALVPGSDPRLEFPGALPLPLIYFLLPALEPCQPCRHLCKGSCLFLAPTHFPSLSWGLLIHAWDLLV